MSIIISYSLFDQPDKKFNRGSHDPLDKDQYRYWLNLPYLLMTNNMILPNSITRIYIPKILENNKFYPLLDKLNTSIEHLEVIKIDKQYIQTEPSIWRIKALWDKNINFCFCRDLDSIIMKKEAQAMRYFMNSNLMIHNIRSIEHHNGEGTSIMAGLNGFNVKKTQKELPLPDSFEHYLKFYKITTKSGVWGCDQETLINFFLRCRTQRIIKQVLDTYIQPTRNNKNHGRAYKNKHYNMTSIDEYIYNNITFKPITERILKIPNTFSHWAGQPVNANGKNITRVSNIINNNTSKEIMNIIKSNKEYRLLYNV